MRKFLINSRILDADGTVSLTSLLMYVLVVRLAIVPDITMEQLGALFLGLATYNAKKAFAASKAKTEAAAASSADEFAGEFKQLKDTVQDLTRILSIKG